MVGGQFSVLSTDIFFAIVGAQYDQGRAASLAWVLTLFALGVFALQRGVLGKQQLHHRERQGRRRHRRWPLPDGVRRAIYGIALPWIAFTWWSTCSPSPAASCRPGAATTRFTLEHFKTAFALEWGAVRPGVGRHRVELAVHHRQAGGHLGAADRGASAC